MRIAIVGLGRAGSALATAFRNDRRVEEVSGTRSGEDNRALVARADVVVLAVKPHVAREAVSAFASALGERLLISICAGVSIADLAAWSSGHRRIVRAMPNTPALVGAGMTVLAARDDVPPESIELARSLFASVGRTETLDESLFDAVTALSGCGPAYVFSVIEALADGGAALGIPRDAALRLASQTVLGSAQLLIEREVLPATLRDEVATPGGATVEGLRVLREGDLHGVFVRAIRAAAERCAHLR